jgi:polyhydroxyalkanoate synthesis regulator phasin
MVVEGLRGYVQAVAGVTEVTRQRARELAQSLLASSHTVVPPGAGALPSQVSGLAEDILSTARSSRGLLLDLVRIEVERSVGALGLTPPAEVDRLRQRVATLERRIEQLEGPTTPAARRSPATKIGTRKTPATKAPVTKAPATKAPATKAPARRAGAKKATATKAPARKAPVSKVAKAVPRAAAKKGPTQATSTQETS